MKIRIFEVGGAVRDRFLGLEPKDIDYAVEAPSWDAMREEILRRGGKIFLEKPEYFTMRAKVPELGATDFVLCRKDGNYTDGRHPDSVEVGTIFDDLKRRDFTMNAIARNIEDGEIFDPFYGREDIRERLIRCVGHCYDRFDEDRLRVFRAVRFAVQKNFHLDPSIINSIQSHIPADFESISTERIREELAKMFKANTMQAAHYVFREFPVLSFMMRDRGLWLEPTNKKS
jgi:poly(A) polymerase/tRNA nucleotidyltransferase (CCA-adding enzyme)